MRILKTWYIDFAIYTDEAKTTEIYKIKINPGDSIYIKDEDGKFEKWYVYQTKPIITHDGCMIYIVDHFVETIKEYNLKYIHTGKEEYAESAGYSYKDLYFYTKIHDEYVILNDQHDITFIGSECFLAKPVVILGKSHMDAIPIRIKDIHYRSNNMSTIDVEIGDTGRIEKIREDTNEFLIIGDNKLYS